MSGETSIDVTTVPRIDNGDSIAFTLDDSYYVVDVSADALDIEGKDIKDVSVSVVKNDDGTYKVQAAGEKGLDCASVKLKVKVAQKPVEVKTGTAEKGTITVTEQRIMSDEKTTLHATLTPNEGYRADRDSVKATITDTVGTEKKVKTVSGKRQKDGTYTFEIPEGLSESAVVEVSADFELGTDNSDVPEVSAGISVAVNVVQSRNNAIVKGSSITAGEGLTMNATTEKADSTAKAIAGYAVTNTGLAGAISVNVASAKTNAKIYGNNTVLNLGGGDFEVVSDANVHFGTQGNAQGEGSAAGLGVGAGLAIAVTGSDVVAAVQDGVAVSYLEDAVSDNIRVMATQKLKDVIVAKAGGEGGVAVMPVLALDITGSDATAYLGKLTGSAFTAGSDADLYAADELKTGVIYALNDASHEVLAKGSAKSGNTAVGATFDITIINDSADARLNHSMTMNGIYVGADSVSVLKSVSKAGAEGAEEEEKKEDGSDDKDGADEQADTMIAGGAGLSKMNDSSNVSAEDVLKKSGERQQAETSEGGVSVAAGFVLNIQDNSAYAAVGESARLNAVRAPII